MRSLCVMIWELVGGPTEKSLLRHLKKEMYKAMDYIIVKVYACKDYFKTWEKFS